MLREENKAQAGNERRRREVSFISSGEQIAAWLFEPGSNGALADASGLTGCVVLAHGFAGVREAALEPFARRFAAAGLYALVFDYRHFGGSTGEPRQLIEIKRQLDDWRAAVSFSRSLDSVDPARIAIWGTSMSGAHVISLAAEDRRLAAAVAQNPMADGLAATAMFTPRQFLGVIGAGIRDEIARLRGRPRVYLPVVGEPGAVAALINDDAVEGYGAIVPERSTWQNRYTAAIGLRAAAYRPVRRAAEISCPILVCVTDRDRITPPEAAVKVAERAPRGEARHYDSGHFEIYVGDVFEQAVADQVEFLARNLRP